MNRPEARNRPVTRVFKTAGCLALVAIATNALAAENSRSRQSPLGSFGGEIAAPLDSPGFFGSAVLTRVHVYAVKDDSGNDITSATAPLGKSPIPSSVPLQTAVPSRGAIPNGTYTLNGVGPVNFLHAQNVVTLLGGYLTETTYAGGHFSFSFQTSYSKADRAMDIPLSFGVTPSAPAAQAPLVNAVAAATQAQITAQLAAKLATQNMSVTGFGDTELSAVWIRHQDRLKVAAGVSLFVPTGSYDANRGPNPGYGNFYSVRPGVAVTYSLNPNHTSQDWDRGVTVAGRLGYMINGTNTDTDYRTGNLVNAELAIVKVLEGGRWAFGANLYRVQQVTDDSGSGLGTNPALRYRVSGIGPFVSFKIPGKEAGFNLSYSQNLDGYNAQFANFWQLRFVKDF
jgi:hypothetical protein